MKLTGQVMIAAAAILLSGCATYPPFSPDTAQTKPEWQDCRQKDIAAWSHARSESGAGIIGALTGPVGGVVANETMVQHDHAAFITKCMADKGYTLPAGYVYTNP